MVSGVRLSSTRTDAAAHRSLFMTFVIPAASILNSSGTPLANRKTRKITKMTENPLPNEVQTQEKKPSKFPRWLLVVMPIVLICVCCIVFTVVVKPFFNVNAQKRWLFN